MHFDDGQKPQPYLHHLARRRLFTLGLLFVLTLVGLFSLKTGPIDLALWDVIGLIASPEETNRWQRIIWQIRLPQLLAGVLAGAGLATSGTVMQAVLRNPLGSPFTLGIAHAGAFGAALSVLIFESGATILPLQTGLCAFAFSLATAILIVLIARSRGASPESMVLSGVALGSLFSAGTMFLQYFADDIQLAAIVFWSFGDLSRADWQGLQWVALTVLPALALFFHRRWDYIALEHGDETAQSLGIPVARIRLEGMFISALISAVLVSFLGIIGFVGLVAPHIIRRLMGDDHRFLLPAAALAGAILLVAADILARTLLAPNSLPVAVLTAFVGAPLFLYLILVRRGS